jgi:hypothetical protein
MESFWLAKMANKTQKQYMLRCRKRRQETRRGIQTCAGLEDEEAPKSPEKRKKREDRKQTNSLVKQVGIQKHTQ